MQAPGLAGSKGFHGNLKVTILSHEVNRLGLPDLLDQKASITPELAKPGSERVLILVEKLIQKSLVSNDDELSGMGLGPLPTMDLENSQLGL
jgi:hypothetical protein